MDKNSVIRAISLKVDNGHTTGFVTHEGDFQWKYFPFGKKNCRAIF